ncbi:hypothetical protein DYB31_010044 [Aphanomyces astaci]|uniref:Atypical/PI3K/PI4K protein kinase n=2 Tax=Aphanomyces astaci TaxID=112090 RepID=A0A397F930_APHAT|nr:hypothetical protein DYB31_010044 [Aphanomyces astaci]
MEERAMVHGCTDSLVAAPTTTTKARPNSVTDLPISPITQELPHHPMRNSAPSLAAAIETLQIDVLSGSGSHAPSSEGGGLRGDLSEVSIDFGESTLLHGTAELTHLGLAGFLNMREHGPGFHRMKRYYCRLVGVLFYRFYTKESARDLANAHMEKEIVKVENWDGKGAIHRYSQAFKLVTPQGTYNVNADSEEEKGLWIQYANESIDAAAMQMRDCSLLPKSSVLTAASPGGLTLARPNKEKEKPPKFKGIPNCMHPTCKVRFDNTKRQHHCRNCGDSVCSDHSYHFAPLPHLPTMNGTSCPQRQCTRCFRVHRFMQHMRTMLQVFVKHRHGRKQQQQQLQHAALLSNKKKALPVSASSCGISQTDDHIEDVNRMRAAVSEADFGVSDAIQALHLHRKDSDDVYCVIVAKLLKLGVQHLPDFDFFLPQLFHLWISMEYETQLVKWMLLFRVLMTAATYHLRLATSIHWLLRATIDDSCGWGFGQRELGVPEYLKFRFAPCKVAMYNLHMLIENRTTLTFTPDADLRTMPLQAELLQVYIDRILHLQEYDSGNKRLNLPTPDLALPSPMSSTRGGPVPLGPFFNAFAACTFPIHWTDLPYRPRLGPRDASVEQKVFLAQVEFIDQLGDLAENLRHCPRSERKKALPMELEKIPLPTAAYYPLTPVDEPLHRFVHVCIKEGTVFTTKARAPTLVWFEVESVDVAPETLWLSQTRPSAPLVCDDAPPHRQSMDHDAIDNVLRDERLLTSLRHIHNNGDDDDDTDDVVQVSIKVPLSNGSTAKLRRSGSLVSHANQAYSDELIHAAEADATRAPMDLSTLTNPHHTNHHHGGGGGPPMLGSSQFPRSKGSIKLELLPTDVEKLSTEQLETIADKLLQHLVAHPPPRRALDQHVTSHHTPVRRASTPTTSTVLESKHPALGRLTVEAIKESMEKMKKNFLHDDDDWDVRHAFTGSDGIATLLEMQVAHNEQHATWLGSELLHNHLIQPVPPPSSGLNIGGGRDYYDDIVFQNDHATLFVVTLKPDQDTSLHVVNDFTGRSTIVGRQSTRPTRYTSSQMGTRGDDTHEESLMLPPMSHMDRMDPDKVMLYMQTLQHAIEAYVMPPDERDRAVGTWQLLQDQLDVICNYVREKQVQRHNQVKNMFGEGADDKRKRMRESSTHASTYKAKWDIKAMIIKSNDDLRQEVLCLQLIRQFRDIFNSAELDLWLYPYGIIATSASTGIIEVILNATSLSSLKGSPGYTNLNQHFITVYGGLDTPAYKTAMGNFVRSMAAYSLVCYILRIKDRHNGNIMLDADGHLIHIDYGFMLGIQPGGRFSLEQRVPFKLTTEMVDAMGGTQSEYFREFVTLLIQGFLALRV